MDNPDQTDRQTAADTARDHEATLLQLTDRLVANDQRQSEQFRTLADAICTLSEQIEVLRNAIDDLRDEMGWGFRNQSEEHRGVHLQDQKAIDPQPRPFAERVDTRSTPKGCSDGRLF